MSPLQRKCDRLWAEIIKCRAGYRSEISGATENLEAHHIANKPNLQLRYSLDNGICLTYHEHRYEAHAHEAWGKSRLDAIRGRSKTEKFKDKVRRLRGEDIYERLQTIGRIREKTDLQEIHDNLIQELAKLK